MRLRVHRGERDFLALLRSPLYGSEMLLHAFLRVPKERAGLRAIVDIARYSIATATAADSPRVVNDPTSIG
jgi:hypothetical protein